jgi:hypothetical protein
MVENQQSRWGTGQGGGDHPSQVPENAVFGKIGRCTAAPMAVAPSLAPVSRKMGRWTTFTMAVTVPITPPLYRKVVVALDALR